MAETQYYQNDPRWKDIKIGTDQNMTIGMVGCLLTSLTMVMNHFGADETPQTLNQKMVASGGFSGAWIKSAMVPSQFPALGVKRQKYVECKNPIPAPMADIDMGLTAGSLVVVQVDREEDRAFEDEDGHWVVLIKKDGNDYQMWDPWQKQGAPTTLVGRYGFGSKKPEEIIQAAIWHGKGELPKDEAKPAAPATPPTPSAPPAPAKPAPGDDKPMAVKPTTELTLRRQPAIDPGNVIKSVSVTAVLTVLDLPSQARPKIGKQGEWMKVREPGGSEGYVAAWFVQETAVTPPPAAPAPATPAQPATKLTVKTTSDSVSFRSAPRVGDDTFIAYLTKGTVLQVVEGGTPASKIGVQGQWLQVQLADGRQGYVAAWYVTKA
jgi:hypothetical protein